MPPPLRVAFFGPAGAGKSVTALNLRQKYKGDVLSFATPIKKLAVELFGERMQDAEFARSAHQQLGQLGRRLGGPNFWVEKLLAKVSETRNCFVDDVRYPSEYQALKDRGFILIRLEAPDKVLRERRPTMTGAQWAHESEQSWVMLTPDAVYSSLQPEEEVLALLVARLPELTRMPLLPG